jgi:tRNA A-37 threonylcarbamoyl transferase component Bud32
MRAEATNVLHTVARAIADGERVDWRAARSRLRDPDSAPLLRHLRFVSALSAAEEATDRIAAPIPAWFKVFVALSIVQVVAGFGALAIAPRDDGPISPYLLAANAAAFAFGATALLVTGAKDRRTWDLAGFFLAIAAACSHRPLRWLMTGEYAAPGSVALFRGLLPEAFLPFFLWRFAGEFPRALRLGLEDAIGSAATRLSAVVGSVLFVSNAVAYATHPEEPWMHPLLGSVTRGHPSGAYWTILFLLCVGALVVAVIRGRRSQTDERRRVSFFVGGLLLGIGPLLTIILAEFLSESAKAYIEGPGLRTVGFAIYLPLLTVPLTLAYAVSARRMLNVTFAVRHGVRRVLARSTVAATVLAAGGVLFWHLYVHRDRSLGVLLADPASRMLALLFIVACLLFPLRGVFLDLLDRTNQENRDRHVLLVDLTTRGRASRTLAEAMTVVTETVRRGLDVDWVNVFGRDAQSGMFTPLARPGIALLMTGALAHILEESESPLLTEPTDRGSVFAWLPLVERHWVLDTGVAAAVTMSEVAPGMGGFIAAGPKREDVAWSREDLSFFAAAASAAAFVLGSVAPRDSRAPVGQAVPDADAADCRTCGRVQPATADRCACGGLVEPSMLPLVLNGKFEVSRVLGRGGMGIVYSAIDLELDRTVALKTLPKLSPDAALRMRREARSMATLIHPHLALIFGSESWRGVPVLVVEYLAGGTLRQRLRSPWDVVPAVALGIALADALVAMHSRDLLHRDVKPSNVAFTSDDTPKLLDFGLAEIVRESDDVWPAVIAGTRQYLSPEALRGAHPTVAQDLWALAIVLYEVLAGTAPPEPSGEGIPDVRRFNPSVPPALAGFLVAALAVRPDRRFKTAKAFRNALMAFVSDAEARTGVRSAVSRRYSP